MLRVQQFIYDRRVERMGELIALKAPRILIYQEANLIIEAWKPSLWYRFRLWYASHIGWRTVDIYSNEENS